MQTTIQVAGDLLRDANIVAAAFGHSCAEDYLEEVIERAVRRDMKRAQAIVAKRAKAIANRPPD